METAEASGELHRAHGEIIITGREMVRKELSGGGSWLQAAEEHSHPVEHVTYRTDTHHEQVRLLLYL